MSDHFLNFPTRANIHIPTLKLYSSSSHRQELPEQSSVGMKTLNCSLFEKSSSSLLFLWLPNCLMGSSSIGSIFQAWPWPPHALLLLHYLLKKLLIDLAFFNQPTNKSSTHTYRRLNTLIRRRHNNLSIFSTTNHCSTTIILN